MKEKSLGNETPFAQGNNEALKSGASAVPIITTWDEVKALPKGPVYIADLTLLTGDKEEGFRYQVETFGEVICGTNSKDRAIFLARCVNSHQQLVDALKTVLSIVHSQVACVDSKYDNGIKMALEALKLAEEV